MEALKNARIATRTFAGFGLVLGLMVLIGGGSAVAFVTVSNSFHRYADLAQEANALSDVNVYMKQTRLHVQDFLIDGNPASADKAAKAEKKAIDAARRAAPYITKPEDMALLAKIEKGLKEYKDEFRNLVDHQNKANQLVAGVLDTKGPELRKQLTAIMKTAAASGDATAAHQAGLAQQHLLLARYYARKFLSDSSPKVKARVGTEIAEAKAETERLAARLAPGSARNRAREIAGGITAYGAAFDTIAGEITARDAVIEGKLGPIGDEITAHAYELVKHAMAEQKHLGESTDDTIRTTEIVIVLGVVLALALGIAAAWFIGMGIARPIHAMTGAMRALAAGDKEIDIPAVGQKDEIGEMAESVQVFRDSMIEADRLAAEQAEAQAAQLARAKRLEELTAAFEGAVSGALQAVAGAGEQMQATAQSMSSIAEETRAQAGTASSASTQTSANVQTVASAAEELSASISEIARQIEQSSGISQQASNQAGETRTTVQELARAADRIGEVVGLISDIAEQTNLLALNATIEAARAGEAGKGFAIVASEVKSLAAQTATATEEISQQVSGIQSATTGAVDAIEGIARTVEELNTISSSISAAVEEQTAATGEISRNVQEAASGTDEVSKTLVGVNDGADETSRASTQVVDAVGELTRQTADLRREVDEFLSGVKAA